jgi:hypothetical protein
VDAVKKEYNRCLACRRRLKNTKYRRTGIGPKYKEKYSRKQSEKVVQMEIEF